MKTLSVQVPNQFYDHVQIVADHHDTTMAAVLRFYLDEGREIPYPPNFPDDYQRPDAPELRRRGEI